MWGVIRFREFDRCMRFDPSDHSTASEAQVAADAQARKAAVDNATALAQENS